MVFKIAFRNIIRHKRRTFFSAITIAVGIVFFILMDSIMAGMDRGAIDNMIAFKTASLRIQSKEYALEKEVFPLNYDIKNYNEIKTSLMSNKKIKGVTWRTPFLGVLSNYLGNKNVIGIVVDPKTDSLVFNLKNYIEGNYFTEENHREILIGKKLAEELGVSVGEEITLYALTKYDSHNADDFKIIGLLNTPDQAINSNNIFISAKGGETLLEFEDLKAEIYVLIERETNLKSYLNSIKDIQKEIEKNFPSLISQNFFEQQADFFEISKSKRGFGIIFLLVLLLIAGVGIVNTVLMSIYERVREIGLLRALGLKNKQLISLFMLEGFYTGFLGSILGLLMGIILNIYLVKYGYPLDKIGGDAIGALPLGGTIYGEWNIGIWIIIAALAIVAATIAAYIPASKAGKMEVVSAMRFY